MAKGARKKTKWVLLTTVPPAEKEADAPSKLPWETKPRTAVPSSEECNTTTTTQNSAEYNSVQNHQLTEKQLDQDQRNNSSYSNFNGYRTHHNYHSHHRSNYSRSSHHYSSGSSRKSHYGGAGYRSSTSTAEVRNEQTSSVTINEDEYTKITTPRQDVLFKKGYLSRPKKHVSSENGLANGSSSTTTTTTDGSEIATGSGSVSTAESITSDSTYLTDGLFMDPYPTPYPYFGYIDQSGVLVMNGFAVDSNGYSYMNGGQTYIYPPNYNLSQSQSFEDGASQSGDPDVLLQTADPTEELPTTSSGDDVPSTNDSEDSEEQKPKSEEELEADQQMTPQQQQQFLAPYANGYDYAQFYNNFYYPGCVMAPFPVVDNGMYYDQFETPSDNPYEFKKHRKWHRNWEEYPGDTMTDEPYQDPSFLCTPQPEEPVSTTTTEVPVTAIQPEQTQATTPVVPSTVPWRQPAANSHKTSSQQQPPKSVETRSQPNPVAPIAKTPKPVQSQKIRKKDLIESTRAFAEQNIDLSRPTYLQKVQKEASTTWKTVCNGKEVAIEEDRVEDRQPLKMEVIEEAPEAVASESVAIAESKPIETTGKPGKGKESKKGGKKTAKGKGKKQKRQSVGHQQKGFEVIEPEFSAVSRIVASPVDEEDASDVERDQEEVIEEEEVVAVKEDQFEVESVMLKDDDSLTVIEAEAEEDLEQMLHDVQLTDIHVNEDSATVSEDHVEEGVETEVSDLPEATESLIEEKVIDNLAEEKLIESVTEKQVIEPVIIEDPAPTNEEPTPTSDDPAPKECDQMIAPLDEDHSCTSPISCSVDEGDKEEEIEDFRHFSGEEDGDQTVDSGVQSPAAFVSPATVATIEEKKERSYSGSGLHVTDAVTKWLSETLNSTTRLEEMFVLPENPELLSKITQQFHVFSFEDSLAFSSDTYSTSSGSSGDEADDADSDYMSDVQVKKAQKTESQKDQLAKQTANDLRSAIEDHSNCKQKRCIIM